MSAEASATELALALVSVVRKRESSHRRSVVAQRAAIDDSPAQIEA
jgi:hypothetical protein